MMSGNIKINPTKLEVGKDNLDSTILPEFTFHHGHVDKICNTLDDLIDVDDSFMDTTSDISQFILVKPTFEGVLQSGFLKNSIPCQPLLRGFSDSIARGDSVIYTSIGEVNYYLGPLNTTNNPNYTPDIYYNPNLNPNLKSNVVIDDRKDEPGGYNVNYKKTNVKKVFKQKNYELDAPHGTRIGEIDSEAEIESVYSDLALEGRHNNSIQIGSRFVNPYITIKNNNNGNNGSIIGLLSLGSINQFFNDYNLLSSDKVVDKAIADKESYTGNHIGVGNDSTEVEGIARQDRFNIEYGKLQGSPDRQTEFDQIIMFSDRITFDAQENDLTMSALRNINVGSGQNISITSKKHTLIESENIYLGKKAKNKSEPMVLGNKLKEVLEKIVKILNDARVNVQGVPLPLVNQGLTSLTDLSNLTDELKDLDPQTGGGFLSKHHYIEQNDRSQNNEG